jgi:hypothetical protein
MNIEEYERTIIRMLCSDAVSNSTLHDVMNNPEKIECKFTGAGYYLDVFHSDLPAERIVLDTPNIVGVYQEIEVGFIAFIEDHVLCLECYNYNDARGVPPGIRNGTVQISTT